MSVYAAIFVTAMAASASISFFDRGSGNQRGPVLAIAYAASDLRTVGKGLAFSGAGRLADLAKRNAGFWLVAEKDGQLFTAGAVTPEIVRDVRRFRGASEVVLFAVPGADPRRSFGAIGVAELDGESVPVAAGGIDPRSLTAAESLHLLLGPRIPVMLLIIAVISVAAMLVALPAFTRALRPITAEATAINPQEPGRRLDERLTPKELLPLVRGFNAALDRLEVELGRRKRFVADVAHELRTPLAAISLRVDSMPDDESRLELQRSLARLTHLVTQMLDLERLSLAGRQKSDVDLVRLARDVVAELAPLAIAGGYDLALVAPDSPVLVKGDAHAITRAIINLVSNSIVHGDNNGQITVEVSAGARIDVVDEGPGIRQDLQELLFEPFKRDNSKAGGCGLGLHLTREIMGAHHGEVRLLRSGKGARFSLQFASPGAH
jgi:signal transduction histidine kinase